MCPLAHSSFEIFLDPRVCRVVAYYNAGSAAVILVLIGIALVTFFWCRVRRRRLQGLSLSVNEEENIPLTQSGPSRDEGGGVDEENAFRARTGKGKGRETEEAQPIFDVGDSDEDDPKSAR